MSNSQVDTVTAEYRIIGINAEEDHMRLFDLDSKQIVEVTLNPQQYSDAVNDQIENLIQGNRILAELSAVASQGRFRFEEVEVVEDNKMMLVQTREYAPGPVEETWGTREDGSPVGVNVIMSDDRERVVMELQVHPEEFDGTDIWQGLQTGDFPADLWFQEELSVAPQPAKDIIFVNPMEKPYIAFYCFPEECPQEGEIIQKLEAHINQERAEDS